MQISCSSPHSRFQSRCGTAAVELAVVAPLVVGLLAGLLEVGQIVKVNQIVSNAAREGARTALTGIHTYTDVQTTVTNYLTNSGITKQSGPTVTVSDVTQGNPGPQFNPGMANWLDQLQITVTLPFSNVRLATFLQANATLGLAHGEVFGRVGLCRLSGHCLYCRHMACLGPSHRVLGQ